MPMRDYAPADREKCLAVFDSNVPRYFRPHERPEFVAFLGALPGPYYVIEDDGGEVIGCGGYVFSREDGTADLCWGMVHRAHHGQGFGRLLLRERMARLASDPRATGVNLHTSQHTRGFYENLAFVIRQVVADGYAPGLDRVDMRLELQPPTIEQQP